MSSYPKDWPASAFQHLVGRTVVAVAQAANGDEGLALTFDDGSTLTFGFSGLEGSIETTPPPKERG